MKKKFLIAFLALVTAIGCAFGLAGCGDDDGAGNGNDEQVNVGEQQPEGGTEGEETEEEETDTPVYSMHYTDLSCLRYDEGFPEGYKLTNAGVEDLLDTHWKNLTYSFSDDHTVLITGMLQGGDAVLSGTWAEEDGIITISYTLIVVVDGETIEAPGSLPAYFENEVLWVAAYVIGNESGIWYCYVPFTAEA